MVDSSWYVEKVLVAATCSSCRDENLQFAGGSLVFLYQFLGLNIFCSPDFHLAVKNRGPRYPVPLSIQRPIGNPWTKRLVLLRQVFWSKDFQWVGILTEREVSNNTVFSYSH